MPATMMSLRKESKLQATSGVHFKVPELFSVLLLH